MLRQRGAAPDKELPQRSQSGSKERDEKTGLHPDKHGKPTYLCGKAAHQFGMPAPH